MNRSFALALCTLFSSSVLAQQANKVDGSDTSTVVNTYGTSARNSHTVISSAFDPKKFEWNIAWPGRVSQYDLVYKSPPVDPMQGIPLGNGDVGALMWCEDSKIIVVVNKCDLWDDAIPDKTDNWKNEKDETATTQRHACRITIDFKFPVFNTLYLSDFIARLKPGWC
jgi:hypothetical protein